MTLSPDTIEKFRELDANDLDAVTENDKLCVFTPGAMTLGEVIPVADILNALLTSYELNRKLVEALKAADGHCRHIPQKGVTRALTEAKRLGVV